MRSRWLVGLVLATLPQAAIAAAFVYRTVAVTGQQAPGLPPGVTFFNSFEDDLPVEPLIDSGARTSFVCSLGGTAEPGTTQSLWAETEGGLAPLARSGDSLPGLPAGVVVDAFPGPSNEVHEWLGGRVAFRAGLRGPDVVPTVDDVATYTGMPGAISLLVRNGDPAPGTAAGTTLRAGHPFLDASGAVLFRGDLAGPVTDRNDEGIWSTHSGTLQLVAREGQAAPGTGAVWGSFSSTLPFAAVRQVMLGSGGHAAFYGFVAGTGVDDFDDEGIWHQATPGGPWTLLVREGQSAPGAGRRATFGSGNGIIAFDGGLHVNARGSVVFGAAVENLASEPPAPGPIGMENIYTNRAGTLAPVALAGQPAPGDTRVFQGFNQAVLSDDDEVAFVGMLPCPGCSNDLLDFGIWREVGGSLSLVIKDGMQVPGMEPGVVFGTTGSSDSVRFRVLGRFTVDGTLLFSAFLSGPDTVGFTKFGLFLARPDGAIETVVVTGQMYDLHGDGTDVRPILDIFEGAVHAAGTEDEAVTFKLLFAEGVVANAVAAPCPAAPPTGAVHALRVDRDALSWEPLAGADAYDVVRGDVATLAASGGDFSSATEECLRGSVSGTSLPFDEVPGEGQAWWFLVRGRTCGGAATWDSDAPGQVAPRDGGIEASGASCP